jgi:hypothetical protein
MSEREQPTKEQSDFSEHSEEVFLEACPGAGKTRSIVDRIVKLAENLPPRRGLAVLSFTNSAVDAFTAKCREARIAHALVHPHFIGTFDGFIRLCFVVPQGIHNGKELVRPVVVDSWETLGIEVHVKAVRGPGISLDAFDAETGALNVQSLGHQAALTHATERKSEYESEAKKIRTRLRKSGRISVADARVEAKRLISDAAAGPRMAKALAARFKEIIVDEGQDCNPLEVEIIHWLRASGIRVTVLADLDQSIYAFRDGEPEGLKKLGETYKGKNQLTFTKNFRSTSVVCRLSATLRGEGRQLPDETNRDEVELPVQVIAYTEKAPTVAIGSMFSSILLAKGIPPEKAIILAHAWRDAHCAAGNRYAEDDGGTSKVATLVRAFATYWSGSARPRERLASLRDVERLLLEVSGEISAEEPLSHAIERLNLDARNLRRKALSLIERLPKQCEDNDEDRQKWIDCLHTEIDRLRLILPKGKTIKAFFRKPTKSEWSELLQVKRDIALRASAIHEVKGQEFAAVCVVIPLHPSRTDELFAMWEKRTEGEPKRVVYVGVTRARDLIAVAVPGSHVQKLLDILAKNGVPYAVQYIGGTLGPSKGKRRVTKEKQETTGLLF